VTELSVDRFPVDGFPLDLFQINGDPGLIRSSVFPWDEFSRSANETVIDIRHLAQTPWRGQEADSFQSRLRDLEPGLTRLGEDFQVAYRYLAEFSYELEKLQHEMSDVRTRARNLWTSIHSILQTLSVGDPTDVPDGADLKPRLESLCWAWNRELHAAKSLKADEAAAMERCIRAVTALGEPAPVAGPAAGLRRYDNPVHAIGPVSRQPVQRTVLGLATCAHQASLLADMIRDLDIDTQHGVGDSWHLPDGELVPVIMPGRHS
jgi:hypothetical protein